jgi:hypothetical protein
MNKEYVTLHKLLRVHPDGGSALDSVELNDEAKRHVLALTAYSEQDIDADDLYDEIAYIDYNSYNLGLESLFPGEFAKALIEHELQNNNGLLDKYNASVLRLGMDNDQRAVINHMRILLKHYDPDAWKNWDAGRRYILASDLLYMLTSMGRYIMYEAPDLDDRIYELLTRYDVRNSVRDYYEAARLMNDIRTYLNRDGSQHSNKLRQKIDNFWDGVEQPKFT